MDGVHVAVHHEFLERATQLLVVLVVVQAVCDASELLVQHLNSIRSSHSLAQRGKLPLPLQLRLHSIPIVRGGKWRTLSHYWLQARVSKHQPILLGRRGFVLDLLGVAPFGALQHRVQAILRILLLVIPLLDARVPLLAGPLVPFLEHQLSVVLEVSHHVQRLVLIHLRKDQLLILKVEGRNPIFLALIPVLADAPHDIQLLLGEQHS